MKRFLLIFVSLIAAVCLASCGSSDDAAKEQKEVEISGYSIVYPDCMGTYVEKFTEEKYSALRLQELIYEACGFKPEVYSDAEGETEREILIGNARNAENSLKENSYAVSLEENDIRIKAKGIYAYSSAFEELMETLEEEGFDIPKELSFSENNVLKEDDEKDFVYIEPETENFIPRETAIKKLTVMGNDISKYRIIYHVWGDFKNPHFGLNESYAAEQLQKYIKLATGVEIPVETDESEPSEYEIVVGITNREGDVISEIDRSNYGEEALLIKTEGERLIISGAQRRGTIYAAYTFLEKYLNVRIFASDCEVVYKADSVDIPKDLYFEQIPAMEYRDVCNKTMHENEYSSKRKVNSNYRRVMNYKQGGNFEFAGEFVHTMGTTLDLDNAPGAAQPCFTDEDTYQKALEKVREILDRKPDCKIVSVTQNDAYMYCGCSSCKTIITMEDSAAGPLIHFINRLADDIKDEHPDAKIMTLSYMFSMEPTKTAPRDNVVIMFCPIDSCCACALNDESCTKNSTFAKQLEGWLDLTDNVYVWYYVTEFIGKGMLPFMNFDAIYENYQYFNEVGVKGVFNEAWMNSYGGEFGALRSYLISLLMWDQNMSYDEYKKAMNEFIDAYYGEASDIVREYLNILLETSKTKHFTQYAAVNALYRTADLADLAPEIDAWFSSIDGFVYSDERFGQRVELLKKGYNTLKKSLY